MVQNDYTLSYNVKKKAIDILSTVCTFYDWDHADTFISWFNKIIDARGRVMLVDICNKIGAEPIEAFTRIGFNSNLGDGNIYAHTRPDGSVFYKLVFPVLKDFTQRGLREDY